MPSIGSIRIGGAIPALGLLRELGADPDAVISQAGLTPDLFDDPENVVPLRTMGAFLVCSARATGCRHFGLLLGLRENLATIGRVGFIMRNSPDLGAALASLKTYLPYNQRGGSATLRIENGSLVFGYALAHDFEGAADLIDASVTSGRNFVQTLCGPEWRATEIIFARPEPDNAAIYSRLLGAPVRFGAPENAVIFPAHWLKMPIRDAEPELRRLLIADLRRLRPPARQDAVVDVRLVIRTNIGSGHCSAGLVAEMFNITERTLHRRLLKAGTSFQTLLEDVRREMAQRLLDDTEASVTEIALALDYSETSAFTRAFRRWTGIPPARWRENRRDEQPEQLAGTA